MDNMPGDVLETAEKLVNAAIRNYKMNVVANVSRDAIANAILAERQRCADICAAEREWGGNVEDAQDRIENGIEPRQIDGWNCPTCND